MHFQSFVSVVLPLASLMATSNAMPVSRPSEEQIFSQESAAKYVGIRLDFDTINSQVNSAFAKSPNLIGGKQTYEMITQAKGGVPTSKQGFTTVLACGEDSPLYKQYAGSEGKPASLNLNELIYDTNTMLIAVTSCKGSDGKTYPGEDAQNMYIPFGDINGYNNAVTRSKELLINFRNHVTYGGKSIPMNAQVSGTITCYN